MGGYVVSRPSVRPAPDLRTYLSAFSGLRAYALSGQNAPFSALVFLLAFAPLMINFVVSTVCSSCVFGRR